jgi:hypothetical protein
VPVYATVLSFYRRQRLYTNRTGKLAEIPGVAGRRPCLKFFTGRTKADSFGQLRALCQPPRAIRAAEVYDPVSEGQMRGKLRGWAWARGGMGLGFRYPAAHSMAQRIYGEILENSRAWVVRQGYELIDEGDWNQRAIVHVAAEFLDVGENGP